MSIIAILETKAKSGEAAAMLEMLARDLPGTRSRPGCESVTVHQDQDDPNTIVLIEQWETKQHQLDYLAWRQGRGDVDRFRLLADGPGTVGYLNFVGA